jgi:hypothetical protein
MVGNATSFIKFEGRTGVAVNAIVEKSVESIGNYETLSVKHENANRNCYKQIAFSNNRSNMR